MIAYKKSSCQIYTTEILVSAHTRLCVCKKRQRKNKKKGK